MVFPESDYDASALSVSGDTYTFTHKAFGADKFRYSANFGKNWTTWQDYEATTTLDSSLFKDSGNFWTGDHVMVQCEYRGCLFCMALFVDPLTQTGATSRSPRALSCMRTTTTTPRVAYLSSSLAVPSTSGASTGVSPLT